MKPVAAKPEAKGGGGGGGGKGKVKDSEPKPEPEPTPEPTPEPEPTPDYVQALLVGDYYRWNYGSETGTAVEVSFTFLAEVPYYYNGSISGFQPFNQAQKAAVYQILNQIEDFANISFVETHDTAQITFGNAALSSSYGAYAYYPGAYQGGDVWVNHQYSYNLSPSPGNYAWETLVHEVGHAIGLGHSHEGVTLPGAEDNRQFTVMSYKAHPGMAGLEPSDFQLYDVAAIQHLYGADMAARAGDDTYTFAGTSNLISTIWDAGGNDTIDASGEVNRVLINLNEGSFSSIGTRPGGSLAVNNVAIAYGTEIENAIGGSGNDVLVGNSLDNSLAGGAGNDRLVSGGGNDYLIGGAGADTFVLDAGSGYDIIADFEFGIDLIELGGGKTWGDLSLHQLAEGAHIQFDADWGALLWGAKASSVDQGDFMFV